MLLTSSALPVTQWAKAQLAGRDLEGLTPMQIAQNLDGYASTALAALPTLRSQAGDQPELKGTLNDIESMAYLGRYYADKIRGAAKLALFRESNREERRFIDESVAHLEDAVEEWKAYAAVLSKQYKTSLLARTRFLDWNGTLKEVEKEVVSVRNEGDFPKARFVNLEDGQRLSKDATLQVVVEAVDQDGLDFARLWLDGLALAAPIRDGDQYRWNAQNDELFSSLEPGWHHLELQVQDKNGVLTRKSINVALGAPDPEDRDAWRGEVHQVILREGERLMMGDVHAFPRLQCFFTLEDDGRIALFRGLPGAVEGLMWNTRGKADRPTPQPRPYHFFMELKEGRIVVWRGTPEAPEIVLWQSPEQSEPGPYALGITAERRLAVFREVDGEPRFAWRTN